MKKKENGKMSELINKYDKKPLIVKKRNILSPSLK